MEQLLFAAIDWLPVVALLCFASVLFLAICVRRYFASRARDLPMPESEPVAQATESAPVAESIAVDDAIAGSIGRIVQTWSAPSLTTVQPPDDDMAEDQRDTARGAHVAPLREVVDVREAVTARVAFDRASAQGLSDLVRALYLDQSNFQFHMIADLQPADRALARSLIEQWIADPTAIDYWQGIYADVCESPDALRADRA